MKILVTLTALLLLSGCAAGPGWLDSVEIARRPSIVFTDEQALTLRVQALRSRAAAVRLALAGEDNRRVRIRHYRELHQIGQTLVPLERTLEAAGRPLKTTLTQPTPA